MILLLLALQQATAAAPSPITRVEIMPADAEVTVGDSLQLTARALDRNGRPLGGIQVRWFLGGGRFEGTVDSTGMVHAGAVGALKVAAVVSTADGSTPTTGFATVRLVPGKVSALTIRPVVTHLYPGQSLQLLAEPRTADGLRRSAEVTWSSDAPSIVSVDSRGRLSARAPGRANIVARSGAVSTTVPVNVAVTRVARVKVTASATSARTGDVVPLTLAAYDVRGRALSNVRPEWALAPGNGMVDEDGHFVGYAAGDYRVVGTFAGAQDEVTISVRPRDVRRPALLVGRLPISTEATELWLHPDGKHGYLGTLGDRIYAVDLSNPASPTITDSVVVDARIINDVMTTADGKYGVMTREGASTRKNGIVILSFEDPAHPKAIAEYTATVSGGVHSAFIYGHHVFLTDDATGSMRVIDIGDPFQPREVARWETAHSSAGRMLHDIDVQDGLAYLSYWNDGLVILDVGNGMKGGSPERPTLVSQFTYNLDSLYREVELLGGPGFIRGTHTAWRSGKYVFVGDEVFSATPRATEGAGVVGLGRAFGRIHVVDVSDIEHPREVAWYEPQDGGAHNVWVAGDTLYLGDYQGGLRVVDISGELRGDLLAQGREIAHVVTADDAGVVPHSPNAWGAIYRDGHIYVSDMNSGLWVVRVEGTPAPVP